MSTWAVSPNISLGEIRPWLDELPAKEQQEVIAFYKKWTDFFARNFSLFTKTYQVADNPGMGSVEVYGHARADHGFVFVVNPQYWDKAVDIPLNEKLGFSGNDICEVKELYPVERLRLTPKGPFIRLGETLRLEVPAQQVIVLEVTKAPQTITAGRIYGLPGTLERTKQGYVLKTSMPQGTTELCEIRLPENNTATFTAEVDANIPKQFPHRFPTKLTVLGTSSKSLLFECTFRHNPAPTQLRQWRARTANLSEGLKNGLLKGWKDSEHYDLPLFEGADGITMPLWPRQFKLAELGPLANFCGGYIDNAFSQQEPTFINIKTLPPQTAIAPQSKAGYLNSQPALAALPGIAEDANSEWWLSTDFNLPFTYHFGFEPFFTDHTFLTLPFVQKDKVKVIKAWINGSDLDIREYRYPRGRDACFYADLTNPAVHEGSNTLVIYFASKH